MATRVSPLCGALVRRRKKLQCWIIVMNLYLTIYLTTFTITRYYWTFCLFRTQLTNIWFEHLKLNYRSFIYIIRILQRKFAKLVCKSCFATKCKIMESSYQCVWPPPNNSLASYDSLNLLLNNTTRASRTSFSLISECKSQTCSLKWTRWAIGLWLWRRWCHTV